MRLATRKLLDRTFSGLGFFSIALMAAALLIILVPVVYRGSQAFVFTATLEHRRLLLERFDRGDLQEVKAEMAAAADARQPIYDTIGAMLVARPLGVIAAIYFADMAGKVKEMLRGSLDALVNLDAKLAAEICARDDEVDALNREMFDRIEKLLQEETRDDVIGILLHLLSVSRHLERIADHATNIAEDVIYMIEGRIIRHRAEPFEV